MKNFQNTSTSTPKTARPEPCWNSSLDLLVTPALELQMCVGRGHLDKTMAPSTTPLRDTLADVDLLPEPVTLLVARPGSGRSRMNSSRNILL